MTSRYIAALAASLLVASSVAADDAPLDEIVVTGDLRERTLPEIASSIALLDKATIDAAAISHFEELSFLVPNLNWAGGSNRARYFQLRGIGERSQYEGAPNPSVGFIIDDIDFSGIGGAATTWDIERIEVLRGPQATRYGANALAGLIYVRSVAPGETFDARARASYGGDDLQSLSFAVGGPVSDTLGLRLSAQQHRENGFRENRFSGRDDSNERDELTLRGRLVWTPGDATKVDATLLSVDQDNGYDGFALDNGFDTYSNRPGRDAQRSTALGIRASHNFEERFSLVSVTGIADSDIEFSFDADWGNQAYWRDFFAPPATAPFEPDYDFFSRRDRERNTLNQEFRLQSGPDGRWFGDSTDWLIGVYALRLEESLATYDDGIFTDGSFAPSLDVSRSNSDFQSTKLAAFGQLDIALTDSIELSAGLRVERRDADYSDDSGLGLSPRESAVGGHLSLTRFFSESLSGYFSLSRGYKLGGFNLGDVPAGRREYDAEFLWNLESGVRWQHARGSVSVAAFYAERRDQQVATSFQLVPNDPSTFVFFQDNAASGRNLGLELESSLRLNDQWSLYANLGLLDVTFDEFVTAEVDLSGREQAHAPDYSFAAGVSWQHPRGWFARLDVNGKDAFYFSNSHDRRSEAYELVNARVGVARGSWQVSVWARNITDERYAVRGFFFGNEPPAFEDSLYVRLGDPRQLGISVDWQY